MRKNDLVRESLIKHTANKENLLNNILTIVRKEEELESETRKNSMFILELLHRKKMYGYEIAKEIELKSQGILSFKEGELYPLLHDLEIDGLLKSCWLENSSDNIGTRKYYEITTKGLNQLSGERELTPKLNTFNSTTMEVLSWK